MSLDPSIMTRLQDLVRQDASLQQRLQDAANVEEAADVLATAAAAHGIPVDPDALLAHAGEAASSQAALQDAELEAVAGGAEQRFVIASIFSAGVLCAVISIAHRQSHAPGRCGD